jgi:hypothetical protein
MSDVKRKMRLRDKVIIYTVMLIGLAGAGYQLYLQAKFKEIEQRQAPVEPVQETDSHAFTLKMQDHKNF